MATSKAKKAKKSGNAKGKTTLKSKATTAAKVEKKAEVVIEKTEAKKPTESKKVEKTEKVETKDTKNEEVKVITAKKPSAVKNFFARKFDASENILTIFKDTRIIGALLGEIIGVMLVTIIALTLGLLNPLYMIFVYLGVTMLVFRVSGANLNPIITIGLLATRRMSAIRGVLYILVQILGAWLAYLVVNAFYHVGIDSGAIQATSVALPQLTPASEIKTATEGYSMFWPIVMLEMTGAIIIAFTYARALGYKKSAFTFASVVSTGVFAALLVCVVVCNNFFYLNDNIFVLNPAISFVYGLFPANAESFDALMQALMPMLVTYVIFPSLGGAVGFYLSDLMDAMSGKKLEA